ncbi:MAG: hypothetical protein AAFP04_02905 [Myxococcota bacterium]
MFRLLLHYCWEVLSLHNEIENELPGRILIPDGAMGTMIQRYQLEEADFRGELLAECQRWLSTSLADEPEAE